MTGHPAGLRTLFFTEMWERFSYYGMRAILVLFMVDAVRGGMGLTDKAAAAIYGLYTAGVYLAALPGGWIADRFLGARRSVFLGGSIIAAGHFVLAIPSVSAFFAGLLLIVSGTGLLKPNISVLVGELYPEGGARRDAGFTIFYMGINIGAALGPLVCSALGEKLNWHFGFAAAGGGMVFGLIQFSRGRGQLPPANETESRTPLSKGQRSVLLALGAAAVIVVGGSFLGLIRINPVTLARGAAGAICLIAILYFAFIYFMGRLDAEERGRLRVIMVLFISSALFWAGFEQVGSAFNLFAQRFTDRTFGSFLVPAGWFQSLGPVFIIVFAPVFAALWVRLGRSGKDPSLAVKFGAGLILLGAGFAVMAGAAAVAGSGVKAAPWWLVSTYLLHTFGELCLSPVGLSSVTKLAPKRFMGQLMGTWFLGSSLGNLLAGLLAGHARMDSSTPNASLFLAMLWLPLISGVALLAISPVVRRWSGGIR